MGVYPIPDEAWIRKFPFCPNDTLSDAARSKFVKQSEESDGGVDVSQDESSIDEVRLSKVKESIFPYLFIYLYTNWFSLKRPRAALEDFILDFRDVPFVYNSELDLLGMVAGISEISGEPFFERLVAGTKLHNKLYATAQKCLEQMTYTHST